jgi:microcystin-dependent protein
MHRIDGVGATLDNRFTQGNPATGVPATQVTPEWANAVQEEIAYVIEQAGISLNKPSNTQLRAAINSMVLGSQSVARYFQQYNGTGSLTAITLPVAPPSALACTVWVNGVIQMPTVAFTVAGNVLTFTVAPPAGTGNIGVLIEGTASEVASQFSAGMIMPYAGITAPSGWLLCDGSAISRTTFGSLFAVLGTSYGAGDGSVTFNLPDFRGRVPAGLDNLGGTAANRIADLNSLGGNGGAASVTPTGTVGNTTLTEAQIPAHTHQVTPFQAAKAAGGVVASPDLIGGTATPVVTSSTGGGGAHTHSLTINSTSVLQPYLGVGFIIKA